MNTPAHRAVRAACAGACLALGACAQPLAERHPFFSTLGGSAQRIADRTQGAIAREQAAAREADARCGPNGDGKNKPECAVPARRSGVERAEAPR